MLLWKKVKWGLFSINNFNNQNYDLLATLIIVISAFYFVCRNIAAFKSYIRTDLSGKPIVGNIELGNAAISRCDSIEFSRDKQQPVKTCNMTRLL